jgi:hypothetical protein
MEKNKGAYLGTEINQKWWKRYTKLEFFSRGNGEYWLDDNGLYFLKFFTRANIFIPFDSIIEVKIGTWHSGRWALGAKILKVVWVKDGLMLSSGFIVSKQEDQLNKFKSLLLSNLKNKN